MIENTSTNSEQEDNDIQMIIEIYKIWDKIYPERFCPGEIPQGTSIQLYDKNNILKETPIQRKIRKMLTHNRKFLDDVDYRWNPELAPKKYYSDGVPID
jgi:hypothetical protein